MTTLATRRTGADDLEDNEKVLVWWLAQNLSQTLVSSSIGISPWISRVVNEMSQAKPKVISSRLAAQRLRLA